MFTCLIRNKLDAFDSLAEHIESIGSTCVRQENVETSTHLPSALDVSVDILTAQALFQTLDVSVHVS